MRKYYAFNGQSNTTTGQPNKLTGLYSRHGDLVLFKTKKDRDKYCNTLNIRFNNYPQTTNKQEAKSKYFAGMTQRQFDEYLEMLDYYAGE